MKNLIKAIVFLVLISIAGMLIGCSDEPPRWKNVSIHAYPEFPDKLYVKYGNGDFHEEENGENFNIDLAVNDNNQFKLIIESYSMDVDKIYFDGEQKKGSEEHEFIRFSANKIMLTGTFIPGYDFYEIFISEDKLK